MDILAKISQNIFAYSFPNIQSFFFLFCEKKLHFLAGSLRIILFDVVFLTGSRTYSRPDGHTSDDRIWAYYRRQNGQTPTTEYWHTTDDRNRYTTDNRTDILLTTGYGLTTDERTDKLPTTGRTYADGHLYRTNIHRAETAIIRFNRYSFSRSYNKIIA